MTFKPPISVIMPVYNAESYLKESISSILNQTFSDFEFIIIDDGSTDNSKKIIRSFKDKRIVLLENETNIKLVKTLNRGIEAAKGMYLARMDADDIACPERLCKQVAFLKKYPLIGLCGTWYKNIGDKKGVTKLAVSHEEIVFRLLVHFEMLHPSWMLRTDIIKKHNIKYEDLYGEDYDFLIRFINYSKIANIPEVLMMYRQFSNSMSKSNKQITEDNCNVIKKRLFNNFNVKVTTEELLLFKNLFYQSYHFTSSQIDSLENLLLRMIKGNRESNFFDQDFFNQRIGYLWDHLCYNSSIDKNNLLKKHGNSELLDFYTPTISRFKFLIANYLRKYNI